MLTFEYQFTYKFSCTIARHYTEIDRKKIEGSFDAYYQLTDDEIKFQILKYVPVGYCSVSEVKEILDNCFVDVCKPTIEECVMLDLTHGEGNAKVWCDMLRELKANKQSFLLPADETFKGSYTRAFIDDYIKIPEGY